MPAQQVGKRIEDENFDARPVSIEGFRIAELDLEAIQWQRARCVLQILVV